MVSWSEFYNTTSLFRLSYREMASIELAKLLKKIVSYEQDVGQDITIGEDVVTSTKNFKYLGSIIQSTGKIEEDVMHRIQAGWLKWRASTGEIEGD